jgi:hypothetical protein
VANQRFSQDGQNEALIDIFKHQAEFERYGVFGFGPFWYQSESGFGTEGLKSTNNQPFKVWHTYKEIVNSIATQSDYIHSMAFLDLDYGSEIELPITLRWISRGRTGDITYSLYYQTEDQERVLIAENLEGSSNEIMQLLWEPCNFPTTPILNLVVVADDGSECISPKVSYKTPTSISDATFDFENETFTSFQPITSGLSLEISDQSTSGSKSLQVNLANRGVDWNYLSLTGPIS